MTTRGMGLDEADKIAHLICDILLDIQNASTALAAKQQILQLCRQFPVYSL
jgi:glycine hydroxymethyltransferase